MVAKCGWVFLGLVMVIWVTWFHPGDSGFGVAASTLPATDSDAGEDRDALRRTESFLHSGAGPRQFDRQGLPECVSDQYYFDGPFPVSAACEGMGNLLLPNWVPVAIKGRKVDCDGLVVEAGYVRVRELLPRAEKDELIFDADLIDIVNFAALEQQVVPSEAVGYTLEFNDLSWGDVDGDGDWDLLGVVYLYFDSCGGDPSQNLQMWFRNPGLRVPGDANSDGALRGDLNNDCVVDGADLGLFLVEFGSTCR